MPPKTTSTSTKKKANSSNEVTSRLYGNKKKDDPNSPDSKSPSRPVQSRQRKRDQKDFIKSIENAASEVLTAEQENIASNNNESEGGDENTNKKKKTKTLRMDTPAITLEQPNEEAKSHDDDNNVNKTESNTTHQTPENQKADQQQNDQDDENVLVVPIPPLPESMKTSSSSPRRVVTILPANNNNSVATASNASSATSPDNNSSSKKIPAPPPNTAKTKTTTTTVTSVGFLQPTGTPRRKKHNNNGDEDINNGDDVEDNNPNNFVTVSAPSPWGRGSISKRVRATSKSMNVYAADDFHKSDRDAASLTAKYKKMMMEGMIENNSSNQQQQLFSSRKTKNHSSSSPLGMLSSRIEDSHIGTDHDDPDRGESILGRRLRGPLMVIRRFDALDDNDNATLLDINMDGNAKCVSARRPIKGVTGILPTATMIAASKTMSSFGDQVDNGGNNNNKSVPTRKLLQQQQQMKSASQNSETLSGARQLLLNGLNPYFGAGAVSDSARENTGAEYALTQLELKQDPFSLRRKRTIEKYYAAQKQQQELQQQHHQMQSHQDETTTTSSNTKNSIGARRRSSTSSAGTLGSTFPSSSLSGGVKFPRGRGIHGGSGITEKSAYDTLDTHQAQIHVQLSDLIKSAREKTQTRDYLVPSAHAALEEAEKEKIMAAGKN